MKATKRMTDDDFYAKYQTIPNNIRPNENNEFETYGDEMDYIHWMRENDHKRIWTIIDNNDGWMGIVAGYHHVNRMCYLITRQEWEKEEEEYTICDTTELQEQWDSLPIWAVEKITGHELKLSMMTEEEIEDFKTDNFYRWEEMGEVERDKIIQKYKQQIDEQGQQGPETQVNKDT